MEWLSTLISATPEQTFNLFLLAGAIGFVGLVFIVYKLVTRNGKGSEKPLELATKTQVQENTSRIASLAALIGDLQRDFKELNKTTTRLNREVGVALDRLDRATRHFNGEGRH